MFTTWCNATAELMSRIRNISLVWLFENYMGCSLNCCLCEFLKGTLCSVIDQSMSIYNVTSTLSPINEVQRKWPIKPTHSSVFCWNVYNLQVLINTSLSLKNGTGRFYERWISSQIMCCIKVWWPCVNVKQAFWNAFRHTVVHQLTRFQLR